MAATRPCGTGPFSRNPKYAPGTEKIAADGKNGLAHRTEFKRPDGTWVAIRDNLINPTHYYAASKAHQDDVYPPAVRTNLFGCAMPTAGELPDGRPWIICNNPSRHDMYLNLTGGTHQGTGSTGHSDRRDSPLAAHAGFSLRPGSPSSSPRATFFGP